jgi:two-component system NtrC family sensor kinase
MIERLLSGSSSVRFKLLVIVLSPIVVALPVLGGLILYWGENYYDRLVQYKVRSDLAIANQYFERVIEGYGRGVTAFAGSSALAAALEHPGAIERLLEAERNRIGADFLYLLDARGQVRAPGRPPAGIGNHAFWPVLKSAMAGKPHAGIDIYTAEQLAEIDPALAQRAYVPVVQTPGAAVDAKTAERRGMLIHAASPVRNAAGEVVAVIEGGLLLNGNLDFVDRINEVVYREGSLPLGSRGTATLLLDDVRIATNVRMFEGERAIGTRVSLPVRDHVLGEGKVWATTAFVVNDWYVSSYQPLYDSLDRRVGMLYVGFLESPLRAAKWSALGLALALFGLLAVGASALFLRMGRTIFAPLERMSAAMTAVAAGDAGARVGAVRSRDEIGDLARHFDALLDTLQAKNAELRQFADELDAKVAERTRQLEGANRSLLDAQRQLVMSEKLAAIGELTAGVAHEINNPIAVMQGNLDLIRAELGPALAPVRQEVKLLDEQIDRVRLIVTKLLQFARPDAYAGYVEDVDVNAIVADSLVLVRHMLAKGSIEVVQRLAASRAVRFARSELQQVLVNLIVNAVHAMPEGGTLTLDTTDWDGRGVRVEVRDTGAGIRAEDLPRIFDPFFTTKRREGTGLGLSISYALVDRYGGRITAASEPGRGAAFTVWLLAEPEFRAA